MGSWVDDDENIGGFGLLEGEVPSVQKVKPVSKRDPKTRHQRPQEEWTAADVASEFTFRAYAKMPNVPRLINTNDLRIRLAVDRKRYNLSATIEMEALERFFADERVYQQIQRNPANAHRQFLASLAVAVPKITEDFEMDVVDIGDRVEYVVAKDGKKFDNSMPGRAALARHESKLKGK